MSGRSAAAALRIMNDSDNDRIDFVTERFERRLTDESSKLRVEMATEFGKVRAEMANGFGEVRTEIAQLRAEMIDRNADLLKWGLVFGVTQTATIAGVVSLLQ